MALACSCRPQNLDRDYDSAVRALRNANSSEALALTRKLERSCPAQSACSFRARLLEAEILLSERQLPLADSILSENLPQGLNDPKLRARRSMLQGAVRVAGGALRDAEAPLRAAKELAS